MHLWICEMHALLVLWRFCCCFLFGVMRESVCLLVSSVTVWIFSPGGGVSGSMSEQMFAAGGRFRPWQDGERKAATPKAWINGAIFLKIDHNVVGHDDRISARRG
jgi:hypothetical protein